MGMEKVWNVWGCEKGNVLGGEKSEMSGVEKAYKSIIQLDIYICDPPFNQY